MLLKRLAPGVEPLANAIFNSTNRALPLGCAVASISTQWPKEHFEHTLLNITTCYGATQSRIIPFWLHLLLCAIYCVIIPPHIICTFFKTEIFCKFLGSLSQHQSASTRTFQPNIDSTLASWGQRCVETTASTLIGADPKNPRICPRFQHLFHYCYYFPTLRVF